MPNPPKCLLLPIDGTDESLRPVEFLGRLYPGLTDVNLVLSYFVPPLAPIYSRTAAEPPAVTQRRWQLLELRRQDVRRIFDTARKVLLEAGFSEELLQEHVQQREMTVARHACLLADIRKVDAILVQKRTTSHLEGFLRGNSPSALLQHCLTSPIWFTDGEIDPARAAICIFKEEASLRLADHAMFMLSETETRITFLHAAKSLSRPITCPLSGARAELASWARSPAGSEVMPYLLRAAETAGKNGVSEDRIRITLIPLKSNAAQEILSWCRENGIGTVGLGHSKPEGVWSFLKTSITRNILEDFKNMAVWVVQ